MRRRCGQGIRAVAGTGTALVRHTRPASKRPGVSTRPRPGRTSSAPRTSSATARHRHGADAKPSSRSFRRARTRASGGTFEQTFHEMAILNKDTPGLGAGRGAPSSRHPLIDVPRTHRAVRPRRVRGRQGSHRADPLRQAGHPHRCTPRRRGRGGGHRLQGRARGRQGGHRADHLRQDGHPRGARPGVGGGSTTADFKASPT